MKNILVTGGAGYIGSHTCQKLAEEGFNPIVYDNLSRGHESAVKWGPLFVGDIRDCTALQQVIEKNNISTVIHFAALAYVGESVASPDLYYSNNVEGTLSLLNAMKATGVSRLVFSSSCAIYGSHSESLISEDLMHAPINPYGRTKLVCEQIISDFSKAFGLNAIALRYFNACGADKKGIIGEWHEPETHIIPNILRTISGELPTFTIYGDDYPTPDGTCVRDYIHVEDLAEAHLLALKKLENSSEGAFIGLNLGTGKGHSVLEVIAAATEITHQKVSKTFGPRREGDPHKLVADPSRAKKILAWSAKNSDLNTILSSAWKWHQKQISGDGLT